MDELLAFGAAVAMVALKSWQQQNVTYEKVWWIPPTSMCLAFFELYLWHRASSPGMGLWLAMGTGAAIGSICAVILHRRFRDK